MLGSLVAAHIATGHLLARQFAAGDLLPGLLFRSA